MKKDQLLANIEDLCLPIVENELKYELYHIEYVKENNEYYLRLYIDKPNERISLKDCETVSRRISEMLDEKDPIKDAYYLEVSSPGLNRKLYKDSHFSRYIENEIYIGFTKTIENKKNIKGILKEVNEDNIVVEIEGNNFSVPKCKIKTANLEGEI
ncbi:ribosome maturation factor RimP [Clostridium tarantellae]|uniref:Ribosome maturation factor RimP n=1 Tax=Clostridium tarantellae TaxID=39493 RepID=A0A6I1MNC1_9CLOT|nr:ribosome maturation factor RimP [Clostridium tarantellae]MPQ42411.1 ribosome maturation factor RimP [Clostridium tarantellae]